MSHLMTCGDAPQLSRPLLLSLRARVDLAHTGQAYSATQQPNTPALCGQGLHTRAS